MIPTSFESFLEDKFHDKREWNGVGITKDNFEDGVDQWMSQLDVQEVIDYAQEWGNALMADAAKVVFGDDKKDEQNG